MQVKRPLSLARHERSSTLLNFASAALDVPLNPVDRIVPFERRPWIARLPDALESDLPVWESALQSHKLLVELVNLHPLLAARFERLDLGGDLCINDDPGDRYLQVQLTPH